MLIGELVERTGLTRDTIRYYERVQLFAAPLRRENNYKDYPSDTVALLRFVKQLQATGFTLTEIRQLLRASADGALTCGEVGNIVAQKITEIDDRIRALQAVRRQLLAAAAGCDNAAKDTVCAPVEARDLTLR